MNLSNLLMFKCKIIEISKFALKPLSSLEFLDLSRNWLYNTVLFESTSELGLSNIKVLNISDNPIYELSDKFNFWKNVWFRNLREIIIQRGDIKKCDFHALSRIEKLRKLDLSGNRIETISPYNFSYLEILDLSNNKLVLLPDTCSKKMFSQTNFYPALKVFHLQNNRISFTLALNIIGSCLKNLTTLDISFNPIRMMFYFAIVNCTNLEILRMDHLLGPIELYDFAFASFNLKELYLGNNVMGYMEGFNFTTILMFNPTLLVLHLTNIDLSHVNLTSMLFNLENLTELSIVHCKVENISPLLGFPLLSVLNLSFNYIQKLDSRSFQGLTNVKLVSFQSNRITSLEQSSFPNFIWESSEIIFDFSSNPFDCGCHLEWFKEWMKRNKNRTFGHLYKCNTPKEWNNQSILYLDTRECHMPSQFLILSFTIIGFISLFIFSIIIVRRLRWYSKCYIYDRKNKKLLMPPRNNQTEFLYDGFVSYNTRDRKWIMSELIEKIERKHEYKLCLHERDIIPGEIYVDEILKCIDCSRKFLLILSNNFMDDQWCLFETEIANHALASGKGDTLFLILLEDINSQYITRSLRTLLNSVAHAEWTTNKSGLKLFWKNVLKFMDET
ncbi:toll-like receptor 13 [Saccostrea cucullata]|uniref:toll-like receptor 13 n=1 Tax=Saccostrea cuccullata TaxID=36930 RepID=UPI002ED225CB